MPEICVTSSEEAFTDTVDLFINFFFSLQLLSHLPSSSPDPYRKVYNNAISPTVHLLYQNKVDMRPKQIDMATELYAQEGLQDANKSPESNELRALTAPAMSDELGNTTLDGQTDVNSARTAVFATNELLCLILSKIPNVANLVRVSKTWNLVVRRDIGYYMQPTIARAIPSATTPVYPRSICRRIDFHPIVHCWSDRKGNVWNNRFREWTMVFRVDNYYPSVLHRFGDQYLTSPPITHLSISASQGHHGPVATIVVKDGIRLRDVAEVLDELCQCLPAKCQFVPKGETGYLDFCFTARIFCARARSGLEIREREDRMRREVHGWRDSLDLNA
jgi:hypothetical protein